MEPTRSDLPRILEGLNAFVVSSRDADHVPSCTLASAVSADEAGRVTVWVPEATGGAVFADVGTSGTLAIVMEHIPSHRTVQVKGRCVEMRPARDEERAFVEARQEAFFQVVQLIGAPSLVRKRRTWPSRAITIDVTEVYEQTPGPRAGLPIAPGAP